MKYIIIKFQTLLINQLVKKSFLPFYLSIALLHFGKEKNVQLIWGFYGIATIDYQIFFLTI